MTSQHLLKRASGLLLVLLLVTAGCRDGPTLPADTDVSVEIANPAEDIYRDGARLSARVVEPVRDSTGRIVVEAGAAATVRIDIDRYDKVARLHLAGLQTTGRDDEVFVRGAPGLILQDLPVGSREGVSEMEGAVAGALAGKATMGGTRGAVTGGLMGAAAASPDVLYARAPEGQFVLEVGPNVPISSEP